MSNEKYKDKKWLKIQLEDKERSLQDIASEFDITAQTIRYWKDEYNLELHWSNSHIKDERGNKYGNLVVEELSHINNNGEAVWLCEHKEGYSFQARGTSLRRGIINGNKSRPKGESAFIYIYERYEKQAKERGLEFDLTKEQFKEITQRDCYYCGEAPSRSTKGKYNFNGHFEYNGLDRFDNSQGYNIDNIVPCCWDCNRFKGDMNGKDFLSLIKKISKNFTRST